MKSLRMAWRTVSFLILDSSLTPVLSFLVFAVAGVVAFTLFSGSGQITVLALGLSLLVALYEPRRRVESRKLFEEMLAEAVYEACHNLQHLTNTYTRRATKWPHIRVRAAERLLEPPFAEHTLRVPGITPVLDHLVRNDEFISLHQLSDVNLDVISEYVGYFIEHCIVLIISVGRAGEEETGKQAREVIEAIKLAYLKEIALNNDKERWRAKVLRSEAEENKRGLKGGEPRYYWFDDIDVKDEKRHALYGLFRKLSDPPPRPEEDE